MSQQITHHNNFDASNVNFSDLRKNKMGGKVVYISNESRKKMLLQIPKMRAPLDLVSSSTRTPAGLVILLT